MKKLSFYLFTHALALALGFSLGVYSLPVLLAPESPEAAKVNAVEATSSYRGSFHKDIKGSDFLHWAQGEVFVSESAIAFRGEIAPGPDYRVYLLDRFVQDKESFLKAKDKAILVGDLKTFDRFVLNFPEGIELDNVNTVVIWCETFARFISSAALQQTT